jgi:hypothetical protein
MRERALGKDGDLGENAGSPATVQLSPPKRGGALEKKTCLACTVVAARDEPRPRFIEADIRQRQDVRLEHLRGQCDGCGRRLLSKRWREF